MTNMYTLSSTEAASGGDTIVHATNSPDPQTCLVFAVPRKYKPKNNNRTLGLKRGVSTTAYGFCKMLLCFHVELCGELYQEKCFD